MSLNIQYPLNAAERGQLEPFIDAHRAKFSGLLLAGQVRRNFARIGAVNAGTAFTMATPVSSVEIEELSLYYRRLLVMAANEERSADLYEAITERQLTVDALTDRLLDINLEEGQRREILIKIDKALVKMEEMTEEMQGLSNG